MANYEIVQKPDELFLMQKDHKDLIILDKWIDYETKKGEHIANCFSYLLKIREDEGPWQLCIKVVKLCKCYNVPKELREVKALMVSQDELLSSIWQNNMAFITIYCNMPDGKHEDAKGFYYCYGVQETLPIPAESREYGYREEDDIKLKIQKVLKAVKKKADASFGGLVRLLRGNFRQAQFSPLTMKEAEAIRRTIEDAPFIQIIRGIPKTHVSPATGVTTALTGVTTTPEGVEQNEEFIRALLHDKYANVIMAFPIPQWQLLEWSQNIARELSRYKSQYQGMKSFNAGISIPMVFAGNLSATTGQTTGVTETAGETNGVSVGQSDSFAHSVGNSASESHNIGFSAGTSQGFANSQSESVSDSMSQSISNSESVSDSYGTSHSVSQGNTEGVTDTTSIGRSHTVGSTESYSEGKSYTEGQSHTVGNSVTRGQTIGQTQGITSGESLSRSLNISDGTSHGFSQTRGQTLGVTDGHTLGTTNGHTVGHTEGTTFGQTFGNTQGVTNGTTHGITNGVTQGVTNGMTTTHTESNGTTIGHTDGTSHTVSDGTSYTHSSGTSASSSTGQTQGTSTSASTGRSYNTGETFGTTNGVTDGRSHTITNGESHSDTSTSSQSGNQGWASANQTSIGNNQNYSFNGSQSLSIGPYGENMGSGVGTGINVGNGFTDSMTGSSGWMNANGHSDSTTHSEANGTTHSVSNSNSHSNSFSQGTSMSNGTGTSNSLSNTNSTGISNSVSNGITHSVSNGTTSSDSTSHSNTISNGISQSQSTSLSNSHSVSDSNSLSNSNSISDSNSLSHSRSNSDSYSLSNSDSYSHSSSKSNSLSEGENVGTSHSVGQGLSRGQTLSRSNSISNSQSLSYGQTESYGQTISRGQTWGHSIGSTVSDGITESQSHGISRSVSNSVSDGVSQSVSHGRSQGVSQGHSQGVSHGVGTTRNVGMSQSVSDGRGVSHGITSSDSRGTGRSIGQTQSTSSAIGNSVARSNGMSIGQGLNFSVGPNIGVSRGYQIFDEEKGNLAKLLENQNTRFNLAARMGAFYVDSYVVSYTEEGKKGVSLGAETSWGGDTEISMLQCVEPKSRFVSEHLLKHLSVFQPCTMKEYIPGIADNYLWSTIMLTSELAALTHLPRVETGGVSTVATNIPAFSVFANKRGQIYFGKQINHEDAEPCYDYYFDKSEFMHALIAGASGCGKTTSAVRIAREVIRNYPDFKMFVLDWKKSWRVLKNFAPNGVDDFTFYGLDPTSINPIRMNVYVPPKYLGISQWCSLMHETLCIGYGFGSKMYSVLQKAAEIAFLVCGVLSRDENGIPKETVESRKNIHNVTLAKIYQIVNALKAGRRPGGASSGRGGNDNSANDAILMQWFIDGYNRLKEADIKGGWTPPVQKGNRPYQGPSPSQAIVDSHFAEAGRGMQDAFDSILAKLLPYYSGELKRLYCCEDEDECVKIEDLIDGKRIVVLEGGTLDSASKKFVCQMISTGMFYYCSAKKNMEQRVDKRMFILEEAHRIIENPESSEGNNIGTTEDIFNIIFNEGREFGLYATAIVQAPSELPANVVTNCSILIIHRLGNKEDIDMVVTDLCRNGRLDNRDLPIWIAKQPIGQAIVRINNTQTHQESEPALIQVARCPNEPPDNEEIVTDMCLDIPDFMMRQVNENNYIDKEKLNEQIDELLSKEFGIQETA